MESKELDYFSIDTEWPPKTTIRSFRTRMEQLNIDSFSAKKSSSNDPNIRHLFELFGNVLDYIDVMEQDIFDLKVVLATTVQHSTAIENSLSSQTELINIKANQFEFIVNNSTDWVMLINPEYIIESANAPLSSVLHKTPHQMIGRPVDRVWGSDFFLANMKDAIDSCFHGQDIKETKLCTISKLTDRWCEFSYTPFRNPSHSISHVLCIIRDVSARRRAETLLKDHTLYLNKVNDATIVLGRDQKIYFWNKSAERIYGWKAESVIDKKRMDQIISHDQLDAIFNTVIETGEWTGEMVHHGKTRRDISVMTNWTLVGPNDDERFVVITCTDITQKKLLEQQFLRIQRMEGIGSVASGIAHDLNNVLSALFMSIRLLKPKCTDETSVQILDLLDNSAKRGVSLVRQILEFARGMDGDLAIVPIPKLLTEISEFVKTTFPKTISISCKIPVDLWQVSGNPTQIHQVLLNLCVNSRDAMTSGGMLSIAAANMSIRDGKLMKSHQIPDGNYVKISVADTGVGIPKSFISKIFDPFFTTKEQGKGTGLGLSTVQTIVKNHNGYLDVTSRLNNGTEFRIYLPASGTHHPGAADNEQLKFSTIPPLAKSLGFIRPT